jgi:hypothetical protein
MVAHQFFPFSSNRRPETKGSDSAIPPVLGVSHEQYDLGAPLGGVVSHDGIDDVMADVLLGNELQARVGQLVCHHEALAADDDHHGGPQRAAEDLGVGSYLLDGMENSRGFKYE